MLQNTMPIFDWCKKFETKDPYISTKKSIGTDLFMPKLSDEFIAELTEQNKFVTKKINGGILFMDKSVLDRKKQAEKEREEIIEGIKKSVTDNEELERSLSDVEARYKKVLFLIEKDSVVCVIDDERTKILINKLCTIPSGILIDCPEDYYYDVRRKSSSNRTNRRVMFGTIDEDYTYSIGIEIKPDNNKQVCITPDEKIAQIVFHKKQLTWSQSNQISYEDFCKKDSVIEKRGMRTGGWASTGIK